MFIKVIFFLYKKFDGKLWYKTNSSKIAKPCQMELIFLTMMTIDT